MIEIRRTLTHVEEIRHEFGPPPPAPLRRGWVAAVLTNPYAGRYARDLLPMMDALQAVGLEMATRLLDALALPPAAIKGYGKGAIVGAAGELEHGALWHVPGGYAMRERLGWKAGGAGANTDGTGGADGSDGVDGAATATTTRRRQPGNALAIVPSAKKVGPPGCALDVPLTHLNASYVRSHFDAIEVRVPGTPRADEVVYILAMSDGPRVHARLGGLAANAIAAWDGQR